MGKTFPVYFLAHRSRSLAFTTTNPTRGEFEPPFSHLQPIDLLTTSLKVERVLRHYVHYHLERVIRSASLLEACFSGSLPE
ncbi:MAG: hypothetical protein LVT47_01940 [Cyanobacteria bacterium LVE1205-1]